MIIDRTNNNETTMNNNRNRQIYTDRYLINAILLRKYNVKNIRELVYAIKTLIKINQKNKNLTILHLKERLSNTLYRKIKHYKTIGSAIATLMLLDIERNRNKINYIKTYNYMFESEEEED